MNNMKLKFLNDLHTFLESKSDLIDQVKISADEFVKLGFPHHTESVKVFLARQYRDKKMTTLLEVREVAKNIVRKCNSEIDKEFEADDI